MNLHIYTAKLQPATKWVDNNFNPQRTIELSPSTKLWCHCCKRIRLAKNCVVQCYYDNIYWWCAPGRGCNDPKAIKRKAKREFMNRSRSQKARRRREEK